MVTPLRKIFSLELSFIWPPTIARLLTRFFTSVILTTTLQGSFIICSLYRWVNWVPTTLRNLLKVARRKSKLRSKPCSVGLELILLLYSVLLCCSVAPGGRRGNGALYKHLLPLASEITAILGHVPGTCELGASCSETLPASEAGLGGHVTPNCVNECLICLSSPLGGVHFGQNT